MVHEEKAQERWLMGQKPGMWPSLRLGNHLSLNSNFTDKGTTAIAKRDLFASSAVGMQLDFKFSQLPHLIYPSWVGIDQRVATVPG